jgi:hypothetical protein
MKTLGPLSLGSAMLSIALVALAQQPVTYPAKGQSASVQAKDNTECTSWAKQQTGFDPAQPPAAAPPAAPPPPKGGLVKGAAAGAAVGAIGGNDVGNAAAKGAVIGGVAQRSRKKGQQDAMAAQSQQAQAQTQQAADTYWRSYGACMSGRGYTVK